MKSWFTAFGLVCCVAISVGKLHAQLPADSLDALHYDISIDTIVNTTAVKRIHAHTQVSFSSALGQVSVAQFNLLEMSVDSVQLNGSPSTFTYNDTLLSVPVPGGFSPLDTHVVEVWYQGRPFQDPSFGGFYFSGSYVYNIGVGFSTNPVNLSRVWFPCHDNFTDRATFEFHVRAAQGLVAACNGLLQGQTLHPDGSTTWDWVLRDDIPPYLAGISVAPYSIVHDQFVSISGDTIPFEIYAVSGDTTGSKTQSANLKAGVHALEQRFGPYRWERLGFIVVNMPLTGVLGAMEHATNIVYPRYFLTQGQSFETIWAHEAGHAWFGNLVTCEDEPEMWLNEGWASYCEYIFTEAIYGGEAYKNYFRSTHAEVLRRAHVEEGFQPLSGIPHAYVYGRTVYSKGSTVAHTLRYQLGDSLFFPAMTDYLDTRAHTSAHSDSLQRSLNAFTGQDWTPFFDGWVKQGGAPHFAVDSVLLAQPGPMVDAQVHIRQRLRGATQYVEGVRATLRFVGANRETEDLEVILGGALDTILHSLAFTPVAVALDPEEHLADATTDNYRTITNYGTYTFPQTWFSAIADQVSDSTWLRVVHHWVGPDGPLLPANGMVLSDSRYWSIEGNFPASFDSRASFQYNGSVIASTGLLDNTWMGNIREDSIKLFYRPGPGHAWQEVDGYTVNTGSNADRLGTVLLDSLVRGDYTLGYRAVATANEAAMEPPFQAWPNPNGGHFHVAVRGGIQRFQLSLMDIQGNTLKSLESTRPEMDIDVQGLPAGVYFLRLSADGILDHTERIVIQK